MGLAGLLGSELQSALGRGLIMVAAPWWVAERADQPLAGAAVALALATGWALGRAAVGRRLLGMPSRTLSWLADCAVALAATLLLMIPLPAAAMVPAAVVVALGLAALQRAAPPARSRMIDRLALDAKVDVHRAHGWVAGLRPWLPWAGIVLGSVIAGALSPTVAIWVCFGLFLQAGEFIFVAVLSAPGLSEP